MFPLVLCLHLYNLCLKRMVSRTLATLYSTSRKLNQNLTNHNLTLYERVPPLGTGCMDSLAWYGLHVFPRLAPATCFPALGTGCMDSRAWYRLHVSRAWLRLHVFPRLAPVTCFPALGTDSMFSRALHSTVCILFSLLVPIWFNLLCYHMR